MKSAVSLLPRTRVAWCGVVFAAIGVGLQMAWPTLVNWVTPGGLVDNFSGLVVLGLYLASLLCAAFAVFRRDWSVIGVLPFVGAVLLFAWICGLRF